MHIYIYLIYNTVTIQEIGATHATIDPSMIRYMFYELFITSKSRHNMEGYRFKGYLQSHEIQVMETNADLFAAAKLN